VDTAGPHTEHWNGLPGRKKVVSGGHVRGGSRVPGDYLSRLAKKGTEVPYERPRESSCNWNQGCTRCWIGPGVHNAWCWQGSEGLSKNTGNEKSVPSFKSKFSRTGNCRTAAAQHPSTPVAQRIPTVGQRDRRSEEIERPSQRHSSRSVLLMG
jgi:hypothetical protein